MSPYQNHPSYNWRGTLNINFKWLPLSFIKMIFYSGTVDSNLSAMPKPAKNAENCSLTQLPWDGATGVHTDNLFNRKRMKGWWPVYDVDQDGTQILKVHADDSLLQAPYNDYIAGLWAWWDILHNVINNHVISCIQQSSLVPKFFRGRRKRASIRGNALAQLFIM